MKNFRFKVAREAVEMLSHCQNPAVALSNSAYSRLVPAFFLGNFQFFCLKESADTPLIKEVAKVNLMKNRPSASTYVDIIDAEENIKFLKRFKNPWLVVYRSHDKLEKIAEKYGFKVLAVPSSLRDFLEEKRNFKKILKKLEIEAVPGENFKVRDLFSWHKAKELKRKYGEKVVFQFAEFGGGGSGTFFIEKEKDFLDFIKTAKEMFEEYGDEFEVMVSKFVRGVSPSMTGCCTRFGTLCGVLQTQALNIAEVTHRKREGTFCGHDWYYRRYSYKLQQQAERVVRSVGDYLYDKKAYRGIFGIDFILDEEIDRLYPLECNPRYTGAFPIYSFLQMEAGEPPFDVFHLLELAGLDYQVDFKKLQQIYREPNKKGSHLRLRNQNDFKIKIGHELGSGIYRLEGSKLKFSRPGLFPWQIKDSGEFLLTGELPRKGIMVDPGERIGRLIFKENILETPGDLKENFKSVAKAVIKELEFI